MPTPQKSPAQLVEEGKKALEALTQRRTRAQTLAETARQQLTALEDEARQLFGTADPEELKKLLARREADNAERARVFSEALAGAETQLKAAEAQMEAA